MEDPYERISSRELYRNAWLAVEAHTIVHPNGRDGEHVLVRASRPSGVLVIDDGDCIFARQPRFGAQSYQIEIVKGGANDGESALACAQRELREELGLTARTWTGVGRVFELPSIVDHPLELFIASACEEVCAQPEEVESIERVRMPIDDALQACMDGRIEDAATIAAIFRFTRVAEGEYRRSTDTRERRASR